MPAGFQALRLRAAFLAAFFFCGLLGSRVEKFDAREDGSLMRSQLLRQIWALRNFGSGRLDVTNPSANDLLAL
jgi:hypothetical protein